MNKFYSKMCYLLVASLVLISLIPFLYIFLISISDSAQIAAGNILSSDTKFTLESYIGLFKHAELGKSLINSVILSLLGTMFNMLFTIPCAYALSRKETKFRNVVYSILIFAMFFRGEIIPSYVWMSNLGLLDSYFAIWLSKLVSIYNIFILSSFFEGIPENIIDAAKMDGASPLKILLKIVIPISRSVLISIGILYLASWWNDYYLTMIYIRDPDKFTLPLRIIQMVTNIEDSSTYASKDLIYAKLSVYGIRAAGIVISIIPMLIVIPLLQRNYTLKNKKQTYT